MKFWKKQLKDEFDKAVPSLSEEVRNAPIITRNFGEAENIATRNGNTLAFRRVGIISVSAAAVLALVFIVMAVCGVFSPNVTPPVVTPDKYIFTLDINPSVAFVTDKNGVVSSVNALNEDADVVLSDNDILNGVKGKPLSEAIAAYTDGAMKLGYLDPTKSQNAVRLSCGEDTSDDILNAASDSLKNYFMKNGIYAVVVKNTVNVKELSERLGVKETKNAEDLAKTLENLSVYSGDRISSELNADELQNLYKTYVVGTQTLEYVRDELLKNVNEIVSNAKALNEISLLSCNIMMDKSNPYSPFPVDYWRIKNNPNASYDEDFAALMKKMDDMLEEYENAFGVAISSLEELKHAVAAYSSLAGVDFKELFSSITLADFQNSAEKYVTILKNIGCDVTEIESLLTAPETTEEYVRQFKTVLNRLYAARKEEFEDIYNRPRTEISEADYANFVDEITRKYGSLENFWNNK